MDSPPKTNPDPNPKPNPSTTTNIYNPNQTISNPIVRNSIETPNQTNDNNSLNQINITKRINGITTINNKQNIKKDTITKSDLYEDQVDEGPIPPWIR